MVQIGQPAVVPLDESVGPADEPLQPPAPSKAPANPTPVTKPAPAPAG